MALLGLGLGAILQNLVLAVQNQVSPRELGAASSSVAFFRSLGGTIGVSALGAVLAGQAGRYTTDGLARLGIHAAGGGAAFGRPADLPAPVRAVVEDAFGHAAGNLFLYAAPLALIALGCVLLPAGDAPAHLQRGDRGAARAGPVTGAPTGRPSVMARRGPTPAGREADRRPG